MLGDDVYCVVDPDAPDTAYLEAAVRLARLLALASLQEREVDVDAAAIGRALAGVREQLEAIRALKTQLTSVSNATKAVWTGLDTLRTGILARVAEAEAELRVAQGCGLGLTAAPGSGRMRRPAVLDGRHRTIGCRSRVKGLRAYRRA